MTHTIGIGLFNTPLYNKSNKNIGYISQLQFYSENLISERVDIIDLVSSAYPITEEAQWVI